MWQVAVAISVGTAGAMLSLPTGNARAPAAADFRILFVLEGFITLSAILAYSTLRKEDGAHLSGHRHGEPVD